MTLSQSLTNLGDAVRNVSWKNDKMTIDEMANVLNSSQIITNIASPMPQLKDDRGFVSNTNPDGSQTFLKSSGQFKGELFYPIKDVAIQLKAGDTIREEVTIKAKYFQDMTANLRGKATGDHPLFKDQQISVSADISLLRYVYTVQSDDTYFLFNFWSNYSGPDDVMIYNPYVAIETNGRE